jgi:hypothetical protein
MVEAAARRVGTGLSRAGLIAITALGCVSMRGAPADGFEGAAAGAARTRPAPVPPGPAAAPRTDRVVLLVLDGVRWQEVFFGVDPLLAARAGLSGDEVVGPTELAPNLHALAQRGVALGGPNGAPVLASGPNFVSLPGYTEILTGHPASCQENDCGAHGRPTLLDDFARAEPPTPPAGSTQTPAPRGVSAVTSWEVLARASARDADAASITSGRDGGNNLGSFTGDEVGKLLLGEGARLPPWPGHDGYRPDRATAAVALHHLAVARPRFLFVSLGDADELAHHGDYRGYLAAIRLADATLGRIQAEVGGWGEEGRHVTVAVTTDHGRCADFIDHGRHCPESARSFFIAAGGRVPRRGAVDLETPIHLRDIAPTLRTLAGVAATPDPRPPGDGAGAPIAAVVAPPPGAPVAAR